MSFPKKFKKLLETSYNDIDLPDYSWIVYAVCGCDEDSCGWKGWIIDGIFKKDGHQHPTGTMDKSLPIAENQNCPICGKQLFRTDVNIKFVPSKNQKPVHGDPNVDYEVKPIQYD